MRCRHHSKGLTAGRGNWAATLSSVNTRYLNGSISRIGLGTIVRGGLQPIVHDAYGTAANLGVTRSYEWIFGQTAKTQLSVSGK
jgi:hypothetical protein